MMAHLDGVFNRHQMMDVEILAVAAGGDNYLTIYDSGW